MQDSFTIQEWDAGHPRWSELLAAVEAQEQASWVAATFAWHRSSHMLVATLGTAVAGFLRFVVQEIGPDEDREAVTLDGVALLEAKVLAFAVLPSYRRQGIGRALQEQALSAAARLGCYQVRSHSSGSNTANHQLKLHMGFAVYPTVRGDDTRSAYFIMPLRHHF